MPDDKKPVDNQYHILGRTVDKLSALLYDRPHNATLDNLDDTLQRVSDYVSNRDSRNYSELMAKTMSSSFESDKDIKEIINTINMASDRNNNQRILNYMNADEICDCIPFCSRSLDVLADGILSPDDITKKVLQVIDESPANDSENDMALQEVKNIISTCGIAELISEVIPHTLKYGDQFVEICDYTSDDVPIGTSLLTESDQTLTESNDDFNVEHEVKFSDILIDESTGEYEPLDVTANVRLELVENSDSELVADKKVATELNNIRLINHDPHAVIKLQSKQYKFCLGYLVLPMNSAGCSSSYGNGGGSGQSGPTSSGTAKTPYSQGMNSLMPGQSGAMAGVDGIYRDLITRLKVFLKKSDIQVDKKEVKTLIARAVRDLSGEEDHKHDQLALRIRFVPRHRMQHFKINSQRFFPYGESVFYKLAFKAKLLIAMEVAATVKRLSDSTDKRLIYIDSNLPRETRNVIEEMKMAFKRKKISIDSFGSISAIPSMISTYEDIYIPKTRDRKLVEFDTLARGVDMPGTTDELKYLRDQLTSGLYVPAAYVNQEENLSSKSALAFENALFTQTILSFQNMMAPYVRELIDKIHIFCKEKKIAPSILVTFPPPKMMQMERDAEKYELASRVVQAMTDMGIPKDMAVRKMVDFDWDSVEEEKVKKIMDDRSSNTPDDNVEGFGPPNMQPMGTGGIFSSPSLGDD